MLGNQEKDKNELIACKAKLKVGLTKRQQMSEVSL
jgi:hypothetical protein